nr:uncharacterized protein LOC107279642 [Oryza sativa Japonica Group]
MPDGTDKKSDKQFLLMAEKPPLSPSSASSGTVKEKIQKLGLTDVNEGNVGVQGDGSQGVQGGGVNQDDNATQLQFNNIQDQVDYAPQHTGQNVNRLTQDQVASMFLRPQHTIDPAQQQPIQQTLPRQQVVQPVQQTPPIQHVVQLVQPNTSNPTGCATSSADATKTTGLAADSADTVEATGCPADSAARSDECIGWPDGTVVPQVIPEHLVCNIQPDLQNYQGGNLNYQYHPPSPHVQYQQAGSAQPQFVPQYNQFEPMPQQLQGTPQQRPWADLIVDVMKEQFGLRPKDAGNLYRQPYPE